MKIKTSKPLNKNRQSIFQSVTILCGLSLILSAAETRYHEYTRKFANPSDGVEIISASYFGGSGHEWLVAGGFSPDGGIVLAGNLLGPEFGAAKVLGTDGSAPSLPERKVETDSKGKPQLQKDGTEKLKPLSWTDDGATGFILRTSSDMKTVISTHRLAWQSGVITSCVVAPDGFIYIAGKAGENIASLSENTRALDSQDNGMESGKCDHTFLAKLSPDASKVLWVRHNKGFSNTPKLELLNDGSLKFSAQDLRNISPEGEETARLVVPKGLGHLVAVNPADGSIARGGEHHSPTGREPWRCPVFNIYNADGSQRHQFYDWLGPYVGLDNLRLVSDTAVRRVTFDNEGNIVLYLWSDGGNSVALREPFDVRTFSPKTEGLGFSAWGAGVLSAAYLVKIDPITYRVKSGTMWMAYLESQNKPNSAWIDQLVFSPDGSACLTARAASSVIQTQNRLSPSQSGQHVAILREDLRSIRFSSTMPGTGVVRSGDAEETWGIATTGNGKKQRVLFLTSSSGAEGDFETPVVQASQSAFGGGWSDGFALLVEMDHNPPTPKSDADAEPSDWSAAPGGNEPVTADGKGRGPVNGQVFQIEPQKWVTADAEFRQPADRLWPSFLYGKPEKGSFTFDSKNPTLTGTIVCDRICQADGTKTGRVVDPKLLQEPVTLEIQSIEALSSRSETRTFNKRDEKRTSIFAPADCVLHIGKIQIPLKAECRFSFQYSGKEKEPASVQIDTFFATTAKQLGLENPDPESEINVRIGVTAQDPSKKKK